MAHSGTLRTGGRARGHTVSWIAAAFLAATVTAAIAAPAIAPYDPLEQEAGRRLAAPGPEHLFGTDGFGRDVLSRVLYGGRTSLAVAGLSVAAAALVGIALGMAQAAAGGWFDLAAGRIVELLLGFPALVLALVVVATATPGAGATAVAIAIALLPRIARVARTAARECLNEEYILSARAAGASTGRVIRNYLIPNSFGVIAAELSVLFGAALSAEATLSFLGLGVPPPFPSWGRMLQEGSRSYFEAAPWVTLVPALTLCLSVVASLLAADLFRSGPRRRRAAPRRRSGKRRLTLLSMVALIAIFSGSTFGCAGGAAVRDSPAADLPDPGKDAVGIVIIIHGANGNAEAWPKRLEGLIRAKIGPDVASVWDFYRVNWPGMADRYLTAAINGFRLGERIGRELASPRFNYRYIHIIGQSLGSTVAHGIAKAYAEAEASAGVDASAPDAGPPDVSLGAGSGGGRTRAFVHLTFLDPWLMLGPLQLSYGIHNFGVYADFAENYFTSDEPVLETNRPLEHAFNVDLRRIVPAREKAHFTYYHDWPIFWYEASVNRGGPGFALSPEAHGAGTPASTYSIDTLRRLFPAGDVVRFQLSLP